MRKFKVGDIVIGNEDNEYSTTCTGTQWKVTKLIEEDVDDMILVTWVDLSRKGTYEAKEFDVEARAFDLFKRRQSKPYLPEWL